ncbi:uncharacterized protein LOC128877038 isoform X3 [Hylaeus volcanicus]|uniref:uncharacterized protein LOC128877038 isoform X3 n=1 Tax=Hylaeus volcanicus TaxID=313075 RepID=UPI0023B83099|nr:uncharacterized protein LOC128877038 isoform X3 [Hylaeus volcanicus]
MVSLTSDYDIINLTCYNILNYIMAIQEMQTVLKEPLCTRVCGGKLDFPRHASFAAIKIVMWWEVDFQAAFNRHSGLTKSSEHETDASTEIEGEVIKKIQPSEFILLVVDTAEHLLEHLHLLIQESLDHADLTVLTATLGAAALIRNCLWCYSQQTKNLISPQASEKINKSYKSYHEMAEAVAERLLDLHCRLISLYILNEADSLSWHDMKAFFERERCSFVIQMWWLYMQATKADLWNTVSPKMAQRVFSGMLNESLSIIVTRFIDARPSLSRSQQFWTDAFNVLCCTGYLALNACVSVSEMIGLKLNTLPVAVRDIHTKCNELLVCLLLRGTPVQEIYQVFRDGFENLTIFQPRCGPATWLLMCAPNLLGSIDSDVYISNLPDDRAVILELNILRHQPQPNWPQLIKVISMNDYAVAKILLDTLIHDCSYFTSEDYFDNLEQLRVDGKNCGGFLCNNMTCYGTLKITSALSLYSLMLILTSIAQEPGHVIAPALRRNHNWSNYLDRQQVWNQSRPPWLNAILKPLSNTMEPIIEILLEAVKNRKPEVAKTPASDGSNNESNLFNSNDAATIVIALAEAICSIDEDNKHTSQIDDFFQRVKEYIQTTDTKSRIDEATCTSSIIETTTDELLFTKFGRQAVKVTHEFLIRSSDLVLNKLRHKDAQERLINVPEVCNLCKPLTYIMFHIEDTTFDQFLVQYEKTNWRKALTMPFSITVERARSQILLRSEFRNVGELTYEDREAMNSIKKICSSIKTTHFK